MPEARLLVVGAYDDEDKAPFVRYARAHNLHGVHFIGYVPPEELPRYYRTATVFCAPSTGFESFGIVLLEAMAAGLPIVASDIPGYRNVLDDGIEGILVQPCHEQEIGNTIVKLLKDSNLRARMSERGKHKAAEYDWSIIARRVLNYYDQLIAGHRASQESKKPRGDRERIVRGRHMLRWNPLRPARKTRWI